MQLVSYNTHQKIDIILKEKKAKIQKRLYTHLAMMFIIQKNAYANLFATVSIINYNVNISEYSTIKCLLNYKLYAHIANIQMPWLKKHFISVCVKCLTQ